jgi:Flp pilus assembly pilin Flp
MKKLIIAIEKLVKDARGANFVEYMVLVALAITGVTAGAKLLSDGMKDGADKQKTEVSKGFIK